MKKLLVASLCLAMVILGCTKAKEDNDTRKPANPGRVEAAYEGKPMDHWVKQLKSADKGDRKHAAWVLGRMGQSAKDAVPALIAGLKDEAQDVRELSAWALGKIGSDAKDAIPALEAALKEETAGNRVRQHAAKALASIKGEPMPAEPDTAAGAGEDEEQGDEGTDEGAAPVPAKKGGPAKAGKPAALGEAGKKDAGAAPAPAAKGGKNKT